jgi:hypothetical protein
MGLLSTVFEQLGEASLGIKLALLVLGLASAVYLLVGACFGCMIGRRCSCARTCTDACTSAKGPESAACGVVLDSLPGLCGAVWHPSDQVPAGVHAKGLLFVYSLLSARINRFPWACRCALV